MDSYVNLDEAIITAMQAIDLSQRKASMVKLKAVSVLLDDLKESIDQVPDSIDELLASSVELSFDEAITGHDWEANVVPCFRKMVSLKQKKSSIGSILLSLLQFQPKESSSLEGCSRLLELCLVALHLMKDPTTAHSTQLFNLIGNYFEHIIANSTSSKATLKATRLFEQFLSTHPTLLPSLESNWTEKTIRVASCGSLLRSYQRVDETKFKAFKRVVLDVYKSKLISPTKQNTTDLASNSWSLVLSSVDQSDWDGHEDWEGLLSTVAKVLKKAPEGSSHSVAKLMTSVDPQLNLDVFIAEGAVWSIVRMLKSTDECVRTSGMVFLQGIYVRCRSAASFRIIVSAMFEALGTKSALSTPEIAAIKPAAGVLGSLTQGYQKICLLLALRLASTHAVSLLGTTKMTEFVQLLLTDVSAFMDKEPNQNIKLVAAQVFGSWLGRVDAESFIKDSGKIPSIISSVASHFEKPPAGGVLEVYLLSFSIALSNNPEITALFIPLASGLVGLVKDAVKKGVTGSAAAARVATLALHILMHSISRISETFMLFEGAKLWNAVSSNASFLYSESLIQLIYGALESKALKPFLGNPLNRVLVDIENWEMLGNVALSREALDSMSSIMALAARSGPKYVLSAVLPEYSSSCLRNLPDSSPETSDCKVSTHLPTTSTRAATTLINGLLIQRCNQEESAYKPLEDNYGRNILSLVEDLPVTSFALLHALWTRVTAAAAWRQRDNKQQQTIGGETKSEELSVKLKSMDSIHFPPSRWRAALTHVLPRLKNYLSADKSLSTTCASMVYCSHLVPLALLCTAHPSISKSGKGAVSLWREVQTVLARCVMAAASVSGGEHFSTSQVVKMASICIDQMALDETEANRQAAQNAFSLLCDRSLLLNADGTEKTGFIALQDELPQLNPLSVLQHLMPMIAAHLLDPCLSTLEKSDLAVYLDPDGAVGTAIQQFEESRTVSAADVEITNADRKKAGPRSTRRGMFGADVSMTGESEEDWVERLKKEKAQKLQEAKLKSGGDVEHDKIREEVMAKYLSLKDARDKVVFSLEFVESFVRVDLNVARAGVCELSERGALFLQLKAPLVRDQCVKCLLKITFFVLEPELKSISRDVVDSLRLVIKTFPTDFCVPVTTEDSSVVGTNFGEDEGKSYYFKINKYCGPIQRLLLNGSQAGLSSTSRVGLCNPVHYRLKPSTFHLVFPVLRAVLRLPHTFSGGELAFHLLDSLWPPGSYFKSSLAATEMNVGASVRTQQAKMLDLCLRLVARPPSKGDGGTSPEKLFLRVATQLQPLLADEWGPVIGELGFLSQEIKVRLVCIQAVKNMLELPGGSLIIASNALMAVRLWILKYDQVESVRSAAAALWEDVEVQLTPDFYPLLEPLLSHPFDHVRKSAASAIGGALSVHPAAIDDVCAKLKELFNSIIPERAQPAVDPTVKIAAKAPVGKKSQLGASKTKTLTPTAAAAAFRKPVQVEDKHFRLRVAISESLQAVGKEAALPSDSPDAVTMVTDLLKFILDVGVIDPNADVRTAMMTAGRAVIDSYGISLCDEIMQLLEAVLSTEVPAAGSSTHDLNDHDNRHAAAVVLLGAAGRHLSKDSDRVLSIVQALVEALRTPSENVQRAVADCLAPLVQTLKGKEVADQLIEQLVEFTLQGETYGERRGAAYGLSATVKGLGIPSLKQHDVVPRLREACANGSVNSRQGALFAFEFMSERLGLLFEPYVISIVEVMLKSFSHSSDHVRDAAQGAAKVIMGRLSGHGVKQVLSPILQSLPGEKAWKSRQEAIRLLGMMAHCAPKPLGAALPQILPVLVQAGIDPHPKVKESAKEALHDISSVIRNPEVSKLSPVLLAAIADPAHKTKDALDALLQCEFMHSIDAPSLALLVPILSRALKDRGAEVKRKGSAITGNMVAMVSDPKLLAPYMSQILPGLKDSLMDPIPDVRTSSARSLGSLFAGIGEEDEELQDFLPWLTSMLQSESSPVERSGAAEGLAEISGTALSAERIEQLLHSVLKLRKLGAAAREGLLWFLSFLPTTLKEDFAVHISITLPVILSGLSDENEAVREVALRAGQLVVSALGLNHTLELLPALLDGLFQEDWRIRQSSVKLLGELLYLVGDTKASGGEFAGGDDDDDQDSGDEEEDPQHVSNSAAVGKIAKVGATIRAHIGNDLMDNLLASLYISRSDLSIIVRQIALQIWKSIVSNTPKTLVEIMPVLVAQMIEKLASDVEDMHVIAGKALGEVVSKLGDKVLPIIVQPLRQGLDSEDERMRQGVCSGLAEILAACTKKQAVDYLHILVPALQQALCDGSPQVCSQAAKAFMTLFRAVGVQAINEIVPSLLDSLAVGGLEAQLALQGLREIVNLRPRDLMDYLLPILLRSPVQKVSAQALSTVVEVAGAQLTYHFQTVVPSLIDEIVSVHEKVSNLKETLAKEKAVVESNGSTEEQDNTVEELTFELSFEEERLEAVQTAAAACMGAITTSGVHNFVSELGTHMDTPPGHTLDPKRVRWACWLAEQFFTRARAEFKDYLMVLLKFLLCRAADPDQDLLCAVRDSLTALTAAVTPAVMASHIEFIRNTLSSTASMARHRTGSAVVVSASGEFLLPLFTIPKGLDPVLAVLSHALMTGNVYVRELAAETMGEMIQMTDTAVLKPMLVKTTGPLIRVIGERFPSSVKAPILQTLYILLNKGGPSLRAFVPQLQTTFVKSLNDPAKEVRSKSASALGRLIPLSGRVDPLLSELCALTSQADSDAIKVSILEALHAVLLHGGVKATPASADKIRTVVMSNLFHEETPIRLCAAKVLGSWFSHLKDEVLMTEVLSDVMDRGGSDEAAMSGVAVGLGAALRNGVERLDPAIQHSALEVLEEYSSDKRTSIQASVASGLFMVMTVPPTLRGEPSEGVSFEAYKSVVKMTLQKLGKNMGLLGNSREDTEVRMQGLKAIKQAIKHHFELALPQLFFWIEAINRGNNAIDLSVRYLAERCGYYLDLMIKKNGGSVNTAMSMVPTGVRDQVTQFVREALRQQQIRSNNSQVADSDEDD